MNKKYCKKIIKKTIKHFIEEDSYLLENNLKEECINHRFASQLEKILTNNVYYKECGIKQKYNVDIEYNKFVDLQNEISIDKEVENSKNEYIRPDILVHKRGSKDYNLIAIELKKGYSTPDDRSKVKDLVDLNEFNYDFGVVLSYLPNKSHMKVKLYHKNIWEDYNIDKSKVVNDKISFKNKVKRVD